MACINSLQGLKVAAFGVAVVSCFFLGGDWMFFFGEKKRGNILDIQLFDPVWGGVGL